MLALVSNTLLPLFIFSGGMNLISELLIILSNRDVFACTFTFGGFLFMHVFSYI
jgi:hypothetical protein